MGLKTLVLSLFLAGCQHTSPIQNKTEKIVWTDKTQDFYNSLNTLYQSSLLRAQKNVNPGYFVCGTVEVHSNQHGSFVLYTSQRHLEFVASDEGLRVYNQQTWKKELTKKCATTRGMPTVPVGFSPSEENDFFVLDHQTFRDGTLGSIPTSKVTNYTPYPTTKRVSIDDKMREMIIEASTEEPEMGRSIGIKLDGFYEL